MANAVTGWRAAAMAALLGIFLSACSNAPFPPVSFIEEGKPARLSEWHLLEIDGKQLKLNHGVMPYELNTPLYTDHAHKLRTVWMRPGSTAVYRESEVFQMPIGTIVSKTFYYPTKNGIDGDQVLLETGDVVLSKEGTLDLSKVRLIETRLLVHRKDGWIALPYVWNADQTDAKLMRAGDQAALTLQTSDGKQQRFPYVVPNENQCASCHMVKNKSKDIQPIGLKARHLNRLYQGEHQMEHMMKIGYLANLARDKPIPRAANWLDTTQPLEARARAYLDINCAHCHNPNGPANNTGLNLEPFMPVDRHLGLCKSPVAAGKGTGDRYYGIVPGKPDDSIMSFRIASQEGGIMMPELGRSTVHDQGLRLIREWIAAMPGNCNDGTDDKNDQSGK